MQIDRSIEDRCGKEYPKNELNIKKTSTVCLVNIRKAGSVFPWREKKSKLKVMSLVPCNGGRSLDGLRVHALLYSKYAAT